MATLNSNTRVTVSQLQEIFDTDQSSDALKQFINMAAEAVDDVEAAGSVTEQRLKLIELNMAAHFASSNDPRVKRESLADASFTYQRGRNVTDYLKTAVDLDPTGTISINQGPSASVDVLDSR